MPVCPDCEFEFPAPQAPPAGDGEDASDGGPDGEDASDGAAAPAPVVRCPSCGKEVPVDEEAPRPKTPWHFKVLLVGTVVYLGWRLYQGIGWLIHHA